MFLESDLTPSERPFQERMVEQGGNFAAQVLDYHSTVVTDSS